MNNGIIILDFGSQYNQLIGRRIREMGVYSEILPFNTPLETILEKQPSGIILSGGPSSVNAENAHLIKKELYEQGIPVLGICYGMQLTAHLLGGKVHKGVKGEYGKAHLDIIKESSLLKGVTQNSIVWMSHFDEVGELPAGFELNAKSGVIASISNEERKIYCVQFHPEVSHTEEGGKMLENFVFGICNSEKNWKLQDQNSTLIISADLGSCRNGLWIGTIRKIHTDIYPICLDCIREIISLWNKHLN